MRRDVDVINVESTLELQRVNLAAERAGRVVRVALRVNPVRVGVSGSLVMGGAATQFGLPEPDVPAALAVAASLPWIDVVGFHIHAVCNNLDAAAHAAYLSWCLEWSVAAARAHGVDLRVVDIGGGLGVPFEGGAPFRRRSVRRAAGLADAAGRRARAARTRPVPGDRVRLLRR